MPGPGGDCQLVKVALDVDGQQFLHNLDRSLPLQQVIQDLCNQYAKSGHSKYGLQLNNKGVRHYITQENFHEVAHGTLLKLIPSIDFMIDCIFNSNEDNKNKLYWLQSFSSDPAFVTKLSVENLDTIRQGTINSSKEDQLTYLVILNNISDITNHQFVSEGLIKYFTDILKGKETDVDLKVISNILKLLGKFIVKFSLFNIVQSQVDTCDLLPFLVRKECSEIQYEVLYLINRYVKYTPDRKSLIEKLNYWEYKDAIACYVIDNASGNDDLSHELYVYQTYVLSTYQAARWKGVQEGLNNEPRTPRPSYNSRCSVLDFEENHPYIINRLSVHSNSSVFENSSVDSTMNLKSNLRLTSSNRIVSPTEAVHMKVKENMALLRPAWVSQLTSDFLEYYKSNYRKNFGLSILESNHEPGFYTIADQITEIVCRILHIDREASEECRTFHPLAFIRERRKFVEELFCRAVWLLARTRREMKAKTLEDHAKVLRVLESQIEMALDKKPKNYKELTETIKLVSYDDVSKKWERESEVRWNLFLENNPCVDDVRKHYIEENMKLVHEQRMNVLRRGEKFPKLPEKKGKRLFWSISLNKNMQKLTYGDCFEDGVIYRDNWNELAVADIQYVVNGPVCPHIKDHRVKKEFESRCFSLLLKQEGSLDFLSENEEIANHWVDGLNALLGKPMTSVSYEAELKELVRMDLNLHYLELQGAPVVESAPPVPLPPPEYRPQRPPLLPKPVTTPATQRKTRPLTVK